MTPKNNNVLHFASSSGSVDIIKLLVDKGISVNLTKTDNSTPLYISAEFGHLEATKALIERDTAFIKVNKYGDTPLNIVTLKDLLGLDQHRRHYTATYFCYKQH